MQQPQVKPFLWYQANLVDVIAHYREIFPNLVVHTENWMGDQLFTAEVEFAGQRIAMMNAPGGPDFTDAISMFVQCEGQAEVDRIWNLLTSAGDPGACGWCKDQFGVSWQVIPTEFFDHVGNPDPSKAQFAWSAMSSMSKIVIADLYE